MVKGLNRVSPTDFTAGIVISDTIENNNVLGKTTAEFVPLGWKVKAPGVYSLATPNTGNLVTVAAQAVGSVPINNPNYYSSRGAIFCGIPQALYITGTGNAGASVLRIIGTVANTRVTEDITFVDGVQREGTTVTEFTDILSINVAVAGINNLSISTYPTSLTPQKEPYIAASLDVNSTSGAILNPRLNINQILSLDNSQSTSTTGYASVTCDGMQVYNSDAGCVATKRNGKWENLYLEDPFKSQTHQVSVNLTQAQFIAMTGVLGNIPLVKLPTVVTQPTFLANGNFTALGKIVGPTTLPYPARVTFTATANTSVVTINGYYNGMKLTETVASVNGVATSLFTYSIISSISITTYVVPITTVGLAVPNPTLVVRNFSLNSINPANTAYITATGIGVTWNPAGLAVAGGQLWPIATLGSSSKQQLTVVPGASPYTVINVSGGADTLYLAPIGGTPANGAGAFSVSMEYDIVW